MSIIEAPNFENRPRIPERVIYAGQSLRREIFLKTCFPDKPILTFNIDPEPKIDNVHEIMKFKLRKVLNLVQTKEGDVIFAADTRTKTPVMDNDTGASRLIAKSKPNSLEEVKETFKAMFKVSKKEGKAPSYSVEAASGAYYLNHRVEFFSVQDSCLVVLNEKKISEIITDEGFLKYLKLFDEFYTSSPYEKDGIKRLTPFNLSGGISLPVLVKMGVVESVHSIPIKSPIFRNVFKYAVQTVAVGMAVDLVDLFGANGQDLINQWPWLSGVVDHSLNNKS